MCYVFTTLRHPNAATHPQDARFRLLNFDIQGSSNFGVRVCRTRTRCSSLLDARSLLDELCSFLVDVRMFEFRWIFASRLATPNFGGRVRQCSNSVFRFLSMCWMFEDRPSFRIGIRCRCLMSTCPFPFIADVRCSRFVDFDSIVVCLHSLSSLVFFEIRFV